MSKPRTKKILEALDAVSDDDSGATCSDSEQEQDAAPEQLPKKQKKADAGITLEDLQKQGYSSGPSVLFMKPPKEEQQTNWTWSNGKAQKSKEEQEETLEERRATHAAATTATLEGAHLAVKASEHAAKLREEAQKEREDLKQKNKNVSWSQKEKRKRDAGQQSRGKSTVEEEKRIARQFGVYSGFD